MPVTAKLSKEFYDTFGERVVNELVDWFNQVDATYRSDLKDINELNFARFDAKQEQRFAEFQARQDQRFAESQAQQDKRFAEFQAKFAEFESKWGQRFADFDAKWERRLGEFQVAFMDRLTVQNRQLTGLMLLLWITLLAPIIGLWFRQ